MTNINSFEISGILKQIITRKDKYSKNFLILILENEYEISNVKYRTNFSILIFDESLKNIIQGEEFLGLPIFVSGNIVKKKNSQDTKVLFLIGKRILKR